MNVDFPVQGDPVTYAFRDELRWISTKSWSMQSMITEEYVSDFGDEHVW